MPKVDDHRRDLASALNTLSRLAPVRYDVYVHRIKQRNKAMGFHTAGAAIAAGVVKPYRAILNDMQQEIAALEKSQPAIHYGSSPRLPHFFPGTKLEFAPPQADWLEEFRQHKTWRDHALTKAVSWQRISQDASFQSRRARDRAMQPYNEDKRGGLLIASTMYQAEAAEASLLSRAYLASIFNHPRSDEA